MYDVYGTLCATYEEACIVAGIETPAQLRAEDEWYAMLEEVENLRRPVPTEWCVCANRVPDYGDFIPDDDVPIF